MFFNRWMDKETVVQQYNALVSNKNKWAITPQKNMEETQMYIAKWKKLIWKTYILDDFNYMTYWKGQNYGDNTRNRDCQQSGGGREGRIK